MVATAMTDGTLDPKGSFEIWILRHVDQAVEGGEVPMDFLGKLRAEFDASRVKPRSTAAPTPRWTS